MINLKRYMLLRNQMIKQGIVLGIIIIMIVSIPVYFRYQSEMQDKTNQLLSLVKLEASLMDSVAKFDARFSQTDHPGGATAATLSQIYPALQAFNGFARTGEIVIAKKVNHEIHFIHSKHSDYLKPKIAAFDIPSRIAEPMVQALQKLTGTLLGSDYRGVTVLSAFTWVESLQLGVVAKMDRSEILYELVSEFVLILFLGVTLYILAFKKLQKSVRQQVSAIAQSQTASQLLVESAGEAIYGVDTVGNCTFANTACAEVLGFAHPDQLLGKNMHEVLHHEHAFCGNEPGRGCALYKAHHAPVKLHQKDECFWRKDGSAFPVAYTSQPIQQEGRCIGTVISFSDMTKQLSEKQRLQHERDFYNAVLQSAGALVMVLDTEGNIEQFNRACEELSGYDVGFVLKRPVWQVLVKEENRAETLSWFNQFKSEQRSKEHVAEWQTKNGERKIIKWATSFLRNEQREILNIICVGSDVTRQVWAEKALNENNALLEKIFDNTHTMIAYLDADFNFIHVNQAYLAADNKTLPEVVGKNHFELYPSKENEKIFKQVLDSGETYHANAKPFEYGHSPEKGITHWDWSLQPVREDDDIVALLLVLVDVTSQIEAQEALLRSEDAMNSAQAIAHFGSWDWNVLTGALTWTNEIYRIFGLLPQSFPATYEAFLGVVHPDDRDAVSKAVMASVDDPNVPYDIEHRLVRPDGEVRYVKEQGEVYRDDTGRPLRMLGVVHDVTEQRDAEANLHASIELNKTIIANSPVGMSIYAENGQCIAANQAMADLIGATVEQVLLQNFHEIDSWKSSGLYESAQKALQQGSMERHEFSLVSSFGKDVSIDAYLSRFESKGEHHLLLMLNDISERKKADAELRIKNTAMASSINPIAISDMQGRINYVNQAYVDMWGYDCEEEILGRTAIDMSESAEDIENVVSDLLQQGSWQGEVTSKRKDGSLFDTQLSASVVHDEKGQPFGMMASFIDVSERKRILDELTHHKTNLEMLIKERTEELEKTLRLVKAENDERKKIELSLVKAKDEAEKANKLKSEFLGRMSHELRTPMNAILGFSQLLEMENLDETHSDYVSEISRAGKHLLELINEVLDLSRIESGNIELVIDSENLHEIINECISLVSTEAEKRSISLTNKIAGNIDMIINVDHTRFKEVLLNLLSNAIKYNRVGGNVTIESRLMDNDMLHISVSDTGPGISDDKLQSIFEPFNRMGAEFTEIEGTGIGLTIAKQLIEMMNGRIGVESRLDVGSTFWIECPVSVDRHHNSRQGSKQDTVKASMPGQAMSEVKDVLYIEDNPANLRLVQKMVSRVQNINLYSAPNAELGIELARSKRPSMILLDINLPGMDGYEALSRLRNYPETSHIPVVALSAAAMPRDIERGKKAGFKHYLTKPLQINALLELLEEELVRGQQVIKLKG